MEAGVGWRFVFVAHPTGRDRLSKITEEQTERFWAPAVVPAWVRAVHLDEPAVACRHILPGPGQLETEVGEH